MDAFLEFDYGDAWRGGGDLDGDFADGEPRNSDATRI